MSIKSKHLIDVVKHVVEDPRPETTLKGSLASALGLLVGSGVLFEVSSVARMSVLAVDVEVLKHVVEVEGKRLVGAWSLLAVLRLPHVCTATVLIVQSSSALVGQDFVGCAHKETNNSVCEVEEVTQVTNYRKKTLCFCYSTRIKNCLRQISTQMFSTKPHVFWGVFCRR